MAICVNKLENLEQFLSINGSKFYGLELNNQYIKIVKNHRLIRKIIINKFAYDVKRINIINQININGPIGYVFSFMFPMFSPSDIIFN